MRKKEASDKVNKHTEMIYTTPKYIMFLGHIRSWHPYGVHL